MIYLGHRWVLLWEDTLGERLLGCRCRRWFEPTQKESVCRCSDSFHVNNSNGKKPKRSTGDIETLFKIEFLT